MRSSRDGAVVEGNRTGAEEAGRGGGMGGGDDDGKDTGDEDVGGAGACADGGGWEGEHKSVVVVSWGVEEGNEADE